MLFVEIHRIILKFMWKSTISRIAKTILKEKYIVKRIILTQVKTYCIATIIKKGWCLQSNKHIDDDTEEGTQNLTHTNMSN